jgi:hypothetical protein
MQIGCGGGGGVGAKKKIYNTSKFRTALILILIEFDTLIE